MAEAKITLVLTPAEFDLLRETLEQGKTDATRNSRDTGEPAATRRHHGQRVVQLDDLLKKLR